MRLKGFAYFLAIVMRRKCFAHLPAFAVTRVLSDENVVNYLNSVSNVIAAVLIFSLILQRINDIPLLN